MIFVRENKWHDWRFNILVSLCLVMRLVEMIYFFKEYISNRSSTILQQLTLCLCLTHMHINVSVTIALIQESMLGYNYLIGV